MEAMDSILSKIAEYTVEPVGRQVGYVIHCNRNLHRLHLRVLRLKADAAEITSEGLLRHLQRWLVEAGDITVTAEELLSDENQANLKCLHGFCPNLKYRYRLGRRSTRLMEEIDELRLKREWVAGLDPIRPREWGVSTGEYQAFPSRTSTVRKIMDVLKSSSADWIWVCGPKGAGKTLLAKEVYRQAREDKKLFDDVVILLDVKKNPDLEVIQSKIVRQLDMKILDGENLEGRASRLHARILNKKILVILDDVWEQIDFYAALGLPRVPTCKILLTSSETPQLYYRMQYFELGPLDDEEARFLFQKRMGDDFKEAAEIRDVATQVFFRCEGLPILIVIVASTLKRISTLTSWENALRCLEEFDTDHGITRSPHLGIEWSYNQLNDEEVKQLFLLCGFAIWGKDIYLPALLKFSMGLGLFSKAYTMEQAKDAFQSSVEKLKDFCLLTDSDDDNRYVRMHDLVREVANRIARDKHILSPGEYEGDYELKEWLDKDFFKKCSKMSSQSSTVPVLSEVTRIYPKLKMLYLHGKGDNSVEMPSNFFKEIQELKVLDLTRLHLLSLPSSLQFLKNMHALFLNQCTLGDVALVGQLSNLEILSFSQSSVKQLPKEIGHLTRLRLLDLSDCSELEVISPNVISSLERLEDLRMRNSFNKWEAEGKRSNASLSELKYLSQLSVLQIHILNADILPANLFLSKLERFNVFIGDEWVERYTRKTLLMVETTLNTLKLKPTTSTEGLDTGLKLLLKITEDLSLDGTEGVNKVLDQLDTQDLEHLKHLQVQNNVDIRYLINREMDELVLANVHCKVLLRNLISFTVHRCDGFLLSPSMARSFVQLKHLVISECQIMEEIVSTKEYSEENKDNMFPKLEKLELSDLPHLTRFCSGGYVEFASLERLQLEKCTKLETFISNHESAAPYFLFDEKVGFPRLEILTINGLPKLTTMWHTQLARNSFCKLRGVTVKRCNSLKSILPDSIIAGAFQELQKLTVEDCVVEEIVAKEERQEIQNHDKFFPKLECLELKSLSQLKRFYPSMPAFSWPRLKTLVFDCQQVNIFTPEFSGLIEKTHDSGSQSIPVKQSSVLIDKTSFPNLEDLTVCMDNWHSRPAPSVLCAKALFSGISSRHPDGGSLLYLRTLRLHGMKKPMRVWDTAEPAGPDFPKLEILEVKFCGLNNLEFSAISFKNLTILEVTFCWRLQYLATYTVAQNLVRLKKLKVDECKNMKEIFTSEGMEEDTSECTIVFSRLQHLELTDLVSLERFCPRNCRVKVPETLGTLEVKWCSFELKISSDGVLEEIVPNIHLEEADFGREESLTVPLNENVGNQLQLKQLDGVETESWLQGIAIKLDEDIGCLQKELSAKKAERRDIEQKLADLVRAKRLSDPSGS
ncbi:disease resistance protein [Rosa sericea]